MSLCPHGYTAFWDCPECEWPMGTALPDEWTRPEGYDGPCPDPDCGSTTCKGWYKHDAHHGMAF